MRLSLLLFVPLAATTFREQSAGAKGFVSCRGVRQPGVFVQLYDEDSVIPFDSDDLMGSTTADGLGHFCVKGTTSEVTEIEPYILIEHNCGYEGLDQKTEFFYYLSKDYIVEGNLTTKVQNLGEIELLTSDAPIQDYKKKYHHHKHLAHSQRERIDQCIPLYVTYKDFFEKEVFGGGTESVKVLPTDNSDFEPLPSELPPVVPENEQIDEHKEVVDITKIDEDIKDIERIEQENLRKLEEETRRLEEETRRMEEERLRLEEERKREEELRRQEEEKERLREEERRREEEERRREDERRRVEEERHQAEERRKAEYEKAMEDYRRREEERRQEILRREEESRREKVTAVSFIEEDEDDPCYRRIKRGVKPAIMDANDPCYRRLKG